MKITALLISHNGARWLPTVIESLRESERRPDRIQVVDTGSEDASVALLTAAVGAPPLHLDRRTPYAESVRAGLAALPPAEPDEWVWLLHDDSAPHRSCLAELVAAAERSQADVAGLGPKIREWPSLKRLLEVGVTLTGTGRRETGLERGEYDQGQHDEERDVLAVNTAGLLIRRQALEDVGLDPALPVFGADVDLGWRLARAGWRTRVVPAAVMFHAEASRRGQRTADLVAHPGRQEREAAQYTLLVNSPGWTLPFRSIRMLAGGLLRALGFLLVRAPQEALDEVVALLDIFTRPGRILRARRLRRGNAMVSHRVVRPLLAPFWLPYRHGLDYVIDVGVAVVDVARERAERHRPPDVPDDAGILARWSRLPPVWVFVALVVLAVVTGWGYLTGEGALQGGALLPAPDGVGAWWSLLFDGNHRIGVGSDAPGPAAMLWLASGATLLFGQPGLFIALLIVLCVPLSFFGAQRIFRRLVGGNVAPLWGALSYALLPVVTGAVQNGRLGTIVATALLPWFARAVLTVTRPTVAEPEAVGLARWRATWRIGLLGAALIAFVPPFAILLLVLLAVAAVTGAIRGLGRHLLAALALATALLLPWLIGSVTSPGVWLVEFELSRMPNGVASTWWNLLLARPDGAGAPAWFAVGIPAAALVALIREDTRSRVSRAWGVALAAAITVSITEAIPVALPGIEDPLRAWPGFALIVMHAAWIAAVVVAATGAIGYAADLRFGWRQIAAAAALVPALATPVLGLGWWVAQTGDGPLQRSVDSEVPTYMTDLAADTDRSGILILSGSVRSGIEYRVLRSGPLRLGEASVLAQTPPDPDFAALIRRLLSTAESADSETLANFGVRYIYAPRPVADVVSGALDAAPGLGGSSAPAPGSRAWIVQPTTTVSALADSRDPLRPLWAGISVAGLIVGFVLAAPERRRR